MIKPPAGSSKRQHRNVRRKTYSPSGNGRGGECACFLHCINKIAVQRVKSYTGKKNADSRVTSCAFHSFMFKNHPARTQPTSYARSDSNGIRNATDLLIRTPTYGRRRVFSRRRSTSKTAGRSSPSTACTTSSTPRAVTAGRSRSCWSTPCMPGTRRLPRTLTCTRPCRPPATSRSKRPSSTTPRCRRCSKTRSLSSSESVGVGRKGRVRHGKNGRLPSGPLSGKGFTRFF